MWCTIGTGSFPGLEAAGRGADPQPLSSAEALERIELTSSHPKGLRGL